MFLDFTVASPCIACLATQSATNIQAFWKKINLIPMEWVTLDFVWFGFNIDSGSEPLCLGNDLGTLLENVHFLFSLEY